MVEETPGITRLMSTLEAKGHIRRSQSTDDRRPQLCSLTTRGRRVVDAAIPRIEAAQNLLIGDLNQAEALQLTGLLCHTIHRSAGGGKKLFGNVVEMRCVRHQDTKTFPSAIVALKYGRA